MTSALGGVGDERKGGSVIVTATGGTNKSKNVADVI